MTSALSFQSTWTAADYKCGMTTALRLPAVSAKHLPKPIATSDIAAVGSGAEVRHTRRELRSESGRQRREERRRRRRRNAVVARGSSGLTSQDPTHMNSLRSAADHTTAASTLMPRLSANDSAGRRNSVVGLSWSRGTAGALMVGRRHRKPAPFSDVVLQLESSARLRADRYELPTFEPSCPELDRQAEISNQWSHDIKLWQQQIMRTRASLRGPVGGRAVLYAI